MVFKQKEEMLKEEGNSEPNFQQFWGKFSSSLSACGEVVDIFHYALVCKL